MTTPEQTLREHWQTWAKEKNLCTDCTTMAEEFMVAEFDSMIAEDIEKVLEMRKIHTHNSVPSYVDDLEEGCLTCFRNFVLMESVRILEARRLSLKK